MRYKSLESLRGIAAIIVALYHSKFVVDTKYPVVAQGEIFVDFFFILSGFVMAFAYEGKIKRGMALGQYVVLRFGRLYPLHLALLLVWGLYVAVKVLMHEYYGYGNNPLGNNNLNNLFSNLFLVQALGVHDTLSWNYPSWSISAEFFAYLLFFVFCSVMGASLRPIHYLLISGLAYGALYFFSEKSMLRTYDLGLVRCVAAFSLGCFTYHVSKITEVNFTFWKASLLELASVMTALLLVVQTKDAKIAQMATFICFAVVIWMFSHQSLGLISRVLTTRFLLLLGTLSYSIYMIHAIAFSAFGNIWKYMASGVEKVEGKEVFVTQYADLINMGIMVLVIFTSFLSYRLIEQPWREKFRRIASRLSDARIDSKAVVER